MNMEQFSAIAQALGNVHRARIVEFLSCGPLCACELQPFFGFTQPTLSNHMRVLRQAGVVLAEQLGKMQIYSLNLPLLDAYTAFANGLFHGDATCVCHSVRERLATRANEIVRQ